MAATIAALSYCDDVHKEITNSDNLRAQIKQYLDEATAAKEEAEHLRVENENLRVGMDELCADISDLKVQLGAMSNALPFQILTSFFRKDLNTDSGRRPDGGRAG